MTEKITLNDLRDCTEEEIEEFWKGIHAAEIAPPYGEIIISRYGAATMDLRYFADCLVTTDEVRETIVHNLVEFMEKEHATQQET